jgi:hypothetical protein
MGFHRSLGIRGLGELSVWIGVPNLIELIVVNLAFAFFLGRWRGLISRNYSFLVHLFRFGDISVSWICGKLNMKIIILRSPIVHN